jgi:hypothetical protein
MKLAEALAERKALMTKTAELAERMRANVLVHEGDTPAEQVVELRAAYDAAVGALAALVKAINRTNVVTRLEDGRILAEAITDRDMLQLRHRALDALADATTTRLPNRYARAELRTLVTVEVPALRRDVDALAREVRALDTRIQAANWATDLIEA